MRKLIFLFVAIVVLTGLWLTLKPQPMLSDQTNPAVQQALDEPATSEPARFVIELGNDEMNSPAIFKVRQGEAVEIQITSEKADEAHLHGYDLHAELQAGTTTNLLFTADRSGRFELELHRSHQTIGVLEVYPGP